MNVPGGVNSVVADHALGFLNAGYTINKGPDGLKIAHAISEMKDVDVFHCHGLYPIGDGYFDRSYSHANNIVLHNALKAKVTICISEFSANLLRHKLHIDPVVTRNGIWIKDYPKAGSPNGPILFAKAGLDANARPDDILYLRDHTDYNLLSIAAIAGIRSTGALERKDFLKTLRSCSIYLGTTKENNSMATMEAMISGVPVVGYDFGFNSEWLVSGTGCELVPVGDRHALKDAISRVSKDWKRYSRQAREYAQIFDWQPVIDELIRIYEKVYRTPENNTVSIVIPSHNYGQFLPEAIESAFRQTIPCEVIVVDDKSTDDSLQIAKRYEQNSGPIKMTVIENQENIGVAETRNKGIAAARGEFIICLDADDKLYPEFAEKHLAAFKTREDAIAYAPINLINERGENRNQRLFRSGANPALHMIGKNQVPSCSMFRKSFHNRVGGYDGRYSPAEDAHHWLKIMQIGGKVQRASTDCLMDYRIHTNSLSSRGFRDDWWKDSHMNYEDPISDRDPKITIILEGTKGAKETLWSLETQDYHKWTCLIQEPNQLQKIFPWLGKRMNSKGSIIRIKAGTILSSNFLREFMQQPPAWINAQSSIARSLSQLT